MNAIKKTICLGLALAVALLCGCSGGHKAPRRKTVESTERQFTAPQEGEPIAIFTTDAGEIRCVLYPDVAPMAVYNFAGLARTGYYDDTQFWRVIYGLAVQGGDATGTGTGGSTIWSNHAYPLESSDTLRHYTGALCAAFGTGAEHSGGNSQFYFVTTLPDSVDAAGQEQLAGQGYPEEQVKAYAAAGGAPYLDHTDTVFGQIYEGLDVADKIACAETEKTEDGEETDRPVEKDTVTIQHITIARYPGPTAEELAEQFAAQSEQADAEQKTE